VKIQSRKGELFEISVNAIMDEATYERFVVMRARNKTYPDRLRHIGAKKADTEAWEKLSCCG